MNLCKKFLTFWLLMLLMIATAHLGKLLLFMVSEIIKNANVK